MHCWYYLHFQMEFTSTNVTLSKQQGNGSTGAIKMAKLSNPAAMYKNLVDH